MSSPIPTQPEEEYGAENLVETAENEECRTTNYNPILLDTIILKDGRKGFLVEFDDGPYRYKLRDADRTFWIKKDEVEKIIHNHE